MDRLSAGIERLAKGTIDIVLLDLWLPDSEGLDTLRRALTASEELPIIVVLTGTDDEELAVKAIRAGCRTILSKARWMAVC